MAKWQPVMLVIAQRLECGHCGALAIFVCLERGEDEQLDYSAWCQECFAQAQED